MKIACRITLFSISSNKIYEFFFEKTPFFYEKCAKRRIFYIGGRLMIGMKKGLSGMLLPGQPLLTPIYLGQEITCLLQRMRLLCGQTP